MSWGCCMKEDSALRKTARRRWNFILQRQRILKRHGAASSAPTKPTWTCLVTHTVTDRPTGLRQLCVINEKTQLRRRRSSRYFTRTDRATKGTSHIPPPLPTTLGYPELRPSERGDAGCHLPHPGLASAHGPPSLRRLSQQPFVGRKHLDAGYMLDLSHSITHATTVRFHDDPDDGTSSRLSSPAMVSSILGVNCLLNR